MPEMGHVEAILRFGERMAAVPKASARPHLLVHCHMGVSRSTAAMIALMAQAHPEADEAGLFAGLRGIRPQAWPNSRMIGFVDEALGRSGRLKAALRHHYGYQLRARPEFRQWMADLGRQAEVEMAIPVPA
jgi:predicted protein tyrosine phosphatase